MHSHLPCSLCAVTPEGSVFVMPQNVSVSEGNSVTFMCAVDLAGSYELQWSHNDEELPGENQSLLNVNVVTAAQGGNYTCSVVNVAGSGMDEGILYGTSHRMWVMALCKQWGVFAADFLPPYNCFYRLQALFNRRQASTSRKNNFRSLRVRTICANGALPH